MRGYTAICPNWVVDNSALTFEKLRCRTSHNMGTFATNAPELARSSKQRKEPSCTVLMQIIKDNLGEMDCVVKQQMVQARTSENESGSPTEAAKVEQKQNECLASDTGRGKKTAEGNSKLARKRTFKKQDTPLSNRGIKNQCCVHVE